MSSMRDYKPDSDLMRLMIELQELCRSRNIELVAAARVLGTEGVLVSRVGSAESIIDLMDMVRTSLSAEGQDRPRH